MATVTLPTPEPGRTAAEDYVEQYFGDLVSKPTSSAPHDDDDVDSMSSPRFRGGQSYADQALASLDLADYIRRRSNAFPEKQRGATGLSPYIRHGLLDLRRVWNEAAGPPEDVARFRLELLWQEYARHWYGRLGPATKKPLRNRPNATEPDGQVESDWDLSMGCVELATDELEDDGWLVGQVRLWLASHWSNRNGNDWTAGEDYFFRHLLDGSRAANRLGWQTVSGMGSDRPYQFSRLQVETKAPGLCATCDHVAACPIDRWSEASLVPLEKPEPLLDADPNLTKTTGPRTVERHSAPDAVWMTAESMGSTDPALVANPGLPIIFVFDRPLLSKLMLSSKRLVFLVETLAELGVRRPLQVHLGRPVEALADYRVATTFAPVPGWRRHADRVKPVEIHPWPWLQTPVAGDISSFNRWYEQVLGRTLDRQPLVDALGALPVADEMM